MVLAALGEDDAEVWVFGSCARMARCGGTATSISRPGRAAPCHSAFWPRLRRRSGGARTLQCQCNTPIRRSSPKSSAKASSGGISAAACRAEGAHHPLDEVVDGADRARRRDLAADRYFRGDMEGLPAPSRRTREPRGCPTKQHNPGGASTTPRRTLRVSAQSLRAKALPDQVASARPSPSPFPLPPIGERVAKG